MNVNKAGLWGELYSSRYLRDKGYKLLTGNYRCRIGEIDLIAQKDGVLCFIEVKTRGEDPMFSPMEAVDIHKRNRIIGAAQSYLHCTGSELPSRFDVIEVILGKNYELKSLNHIKDAFGTLD